MVAQRFKLLLLLLVSSCSVADDFENIDIEIENGLSSCVTIDNVKRLENAILPSASFNLAVNKTISHCGCKSALASFIVYAVEEDYRSYIIGGKVGFRASAIKNVPLSAEETLVKDRNLAITFSCAQPD